LISEIASHFVIKEKKQGGQYRADIINAIKVKLPLKKVTLYFTVFLHTPTY